jgi:hypothetical protein
MEASTSTSRNAKRSPRQQKGCSKLVHWNVLNFIRKVLSLFVASDMSNYHFSSVPDMQMLGYYIQ